MRSTPTSKRQPQPEFKIGSLPATPPLPSTFPIPSAAIPVVYLPHHGQGNPTEEMPTLTPSSSSSSSEKSSLPALPAPTLPDTSLSQPSTATAPTQPSNYIYFTVFDSKMPDHTDVRPLQAQAISQSNPSTNPSITFSATPSTAPPVDLDPVISAKDLSFLAPSKPDESHVVMMTTHPLINPNTPQRTH